MLKIKILLGIFLLIFLSQTTVETTKLNYPRVLLPIFDKISINFTLEVIEKGCFKWTSSRQDLILITPLYDDLENECTASATVTVLTRDRRRNTAIVLAEDVSSGEALRCDVILDVIDKIGVRTTTRQLYLEEAPETFELRAEDSQGNEFTTLEGIEFSWLISSLNGESKGYSPALRFLTFNESPYYVVPHSLDKLERRGLKGSMVLLEGINTGAAKVTVSIPYPEYSHIPPLEVYINVLANIILEPAKAHILVGDSIKFRILQLKMGKLHEISLNDQYFLEVDNANVASLKQNSVTGLKLGRTSIVLRDRNVPYDGSLPDNSITEASIPSAVITVAEPHKLGVSLLPHNNWITVQGERHEIAFDLYTRDDQKITLGPRYAIKSELDEVLFRVSKRNINGTRLVGEAANTGISPVYGSFNDLTAQAELQIYGELWLTPSHVVLPYDPNIVRTQHIQFQVSGGDGSFAWHSQNPRLLQISQTGLASTVIRDSDRRRGLHATMDETGDSSWLTPHASVKVALSRNQKIFRQANVYFLPPVRLEIVKYNFETALLDYVQLQVGVYAYVNNSYVPYTNCENLFFDLEFSHQIFQVDHNVETKEMIHGACEVLHLRATALGLTHLRVSYKFQDKILKDEVTLSVFEPMTVTSPVENEIVLPIGSSRNVIYANGPQRIYTLEAELTKVLNYDRKIAEIVAVEEYDSQTPMYVYRVLCRKVGSTTLDVNIYNALEANNFSPYLSHVVTRVHCVKPRFLNLYAKEQLRSSCPLEAKGSLLHLKDSDNVFEIEIEVQDAKNRRLMNISSLVLEWEFNAGDERYDSHKIVQYKRKSIKELIHGVPIPKTDYLKTSFLETAANLRIKGTVVGYDGQVLAKNNIQAEKPIFGVQNPKTGSTTTPLIENEIRFMAVNSTLFPSDHVSLFMAKDRRQRVRINHGSGYFEYDLSEAGVVEVEFDVRLREFIMTPLRIGHVQLIVTDRCLMSDPAYLSISVVAIKRIQAQSPDRVERTKSIEAIIRIYDSNDNLLPIDHENLDMYALSEEVANADVLSVKLGSQHDVGLGEIRYIITGNNLGETKIIFHSRSNDKPISSQPLIVQVFSPLRLYPRNSTLVVGSSLQIYHQGGPQSDLNIVYEVQDKKIISMESAIVTAYRLGDSKITGKCVMLNPATGREVVMSEDTVEVHVVPLTGIHVKTPLVRIRSGAVMPATVWGSPDLSPMVLGTLKNMQITWSTNQPDVVDINNIFAGVGIEYSKTDMIAVRVKALNPGKARIQAAVQLGEEKKLVATVDVIVFKILELESPKHIAMDWILMAPRSTIQLKANLDDVHYVPDKKDSSGIVRVSPDGVVRSTDTLGRDLLIAKTFEQNLPISVEVKNVQYILASLEDSSSTKLKRTVEKIPRGMAFVLKVSLHDNLGNEFSHSIDDTNALRYELSQKDVVDVQIGNNMTLAVNVPRDISNMIAISLRDTDGVKHAEDYIKLSVAESQYTFPVKTIFSVGDIICFDSPLTLSAQWTSSDERIVAIDRLTGIAKVIGNRDKGEKVVVTNGDRTSGNFIKFDVEVRDVDVIQVRRSQDIFSGSSYRGHFVLRHHMQTDKFTNLIASNISKCANLLPEKVQVKLFTCHLTSKQELGQRLLQHYKVTPIFDSTIGSYACQIDLTSSFNDVLGLVKNNEVFIDLEIRLPSGLMSVTQLKFVPGIKVTPESLFAADLKDQELIVTGLDRVLQKVEVTASDSSLLEVTPQLKSLGTVHYKIKILKDLPMDEQLHVLVQSPDTLQNIKIPIAASMSLLDKCGVRPYHSSSLLVKVVSNIGLIITALAVLVATVWVYISCGPQSSKAEINTDAFASKNSSFMSQNSSSNLSANRSANLTGSPRSPYYGSRANVSGGGNLSSGDDTQVYGDSILVSPQKRINRSFL